MIENPVTLFLNGSPHSRGNSMALAETVSEALPGAKQTIHLYKKYIQPCRDCDNCDDSGICGGDADAMPEVLAEVARADFIIMVSPLHFSSLTAPLIAFISRLQPAWRSLQRGGGFLPPKRRLGALLVAAGSSYPDMFRPARSVALAAFNSLSIPFAGMATAADTDKIPVRDNAQAVAEARALASRLVDDF